MYCEICGEWDEKLYIDSQGRYVCENCKFDEDE